MPLFKSNDHRLRDEMTGRAARRYDRGSAASIRSMPVSRAQQRAYLASEGLSPKAGRWSWLTGK